nr:ras GTPase activating protein 1 [Hymenolepis microstoma]
MASDHCAESSGQWKIPEVPECFHGELTRQDAEKRLLRFSLPNSYLLRLSIYENEGSGQISLYYALSFLTSKLVCQHYKLVPRLQSFQLGERLFQCLKCILSRYYQCPLIPGEYLRVPIPPCSPPQEFYTRRVRAIRRYEPPCNLRLGCFHGELTRQDAEKRLLRFSLPNSYLLRLSIYENEGSGQISLYYALSFLTSKLVCQHYKLVPRLQSFQLGERLFQCLKCILSRYYQCPLIPGEYLRVPIPPCSPPQEFYTRRVRAIRRYEPPCNLRLGCKPADEFLVVDDESHPDWMLVTSVQTRQSGYLPKFCLEKVYPEIIERLPFFHEDSTSLEQQELLKQNGPSGPLHTLSLRWNSYFEVQDRYSVNSSRATGLDSIDLSNEEGGTVELAAQPVSQALPFTKPLYKSIVKIRYNDVWFTSVENVIAAIEAQFNQPNSQYQPTTVELKPILRGPKAIPSHDSIYMAISFNRRPPSPGAIVEIHGELSLWIPQKKKWKPLYASLDREQSIITLTDGDKRKPERIDLSRCDFFPVHPLMFDKKHCFGLLLSSTGEREDYIFAVEPPFSYTSSQTGTSMMSSLASPFTANANPSIISLRPQHGFITSTVGTTITNNSSSSSTSGTIGISSNANNNSCGSVSSNGGGCVGYPPASATAAAASELDPQAYAGRSDTAGNLDLGASGCPRFYGFGEATGSTWSKIIASASTVGVSSSSSSATGSFSGPFPIDLAYMRWLKSLYAHCRNTRAESAVDADPERRRSEVRCFRTLEVKLTNAKLLPMPPSCRREGGGIYSVTVDGLEIARAYSGATNQTITFEEFPFGYKKVEVTYREDKKKRQGSVVLVKLQLGTRRHSSGTSTNSGGQGVSFGSSPSLEVATLLGPTRGVRGGSNGGTTGADSPEGGQSSLNTSSISVSQCVTAQPLQQQQIASQIKTTPICSFQESVSPQATLIYRELYVLPFQCYDKLRKVITSHLETELVPACTFMWTVLASDHVNFQSSLLLACIESKRHLELIVNLLKAIIPADNPSNAFRSNALGQLIMDQYMNMVCSEWRQKCFRRVFNEIAKGPPPNTTASAVNISTSPPLLTNATAVAAAGGRSVRFSASAEKSVSEVGEISSSSGSGSYSISSGSELHRVATCPPQHHREGSPIPNSSTSHIFSASQSNHSEWYSSLVELLIDDLIEYAKEFPLQIRWIYSELQKCPELKSTNAVWCNLLFLRGICPSICNGSYGTAPESPGRDSKTLTTVAKNLIALTSQKRSDNALPPEVFESCRTKLSKFAPHVLSPLSSEELNRLEGLYIEEAMRASANSMSRELAQLASYFQLVFLPDNSNPSLGSDSIGMGNARTLLNKTQLAEHQRPNVPNLRESLLELSHFAPSTFHHHPLIHEESSSTSTSASKPSGVGSGVGLMRGLGGIFSSSSSNPPSFS